MIEELVQRCFNIRHQTHLAHWATKSYSEHVALGDFYDSIIDSIDSVVENYQGCFGLLGSITIPSVKTTSDIIPLLKEDVKWITKNRTKIAKEIPSIENLIDDLTSVYTLAIYKLTNLK